MNAAKKTSKHSWIAPVVALIIGCCSFGLLLILSDDYQVQHDWVVMLPLIGKVLFLYAIVKFLWLAIVSQKGGPVLVAVGLGLMLASWFLFNTLAGLIVGAVLTLVGAGLLIKQRSQP